MTTRCFKLQLLPWATLTLLSQPIHSKRIFSTQQTSKKKLIKPRSKLNPVKSRSSNLTSSAKTNHPPARSQSGPKGTNLNETPLSSNNLSRIHRDKWTSCPLLAWRMDPHPFTVCTEAQFLSSSPPITLCPGYSRPLLKLREMRILRLPRSMRCRQRLSKPKMTSRPRSGRTLRNRTLNCQPKSCRRGTRSRGIVSARHQSSPGTRTPSSERRAHNPSRQGAPI